MDLNYIEMSSKEARSAFLDYRRAIRSRYGSIAAASAADVTTMRAYRELAKGRRVLDIVTVMRSMGLLTDPTMPVLAICRADAQWCRCTIDGDGSAVFRDGDSTATSSWTELKPRPTRGDVGLPVGTFVGAPRGRTRGRAMVPEIPIHLRPSHGLAGYHILWEATWIPEPPADPLLLKHIGSSLFAVLAQWDLTAIEQAVLRGLRT